MKFGRTIRKLREKKNISIAQFARKVGMSPTYLAPIERDVFPPPAESKVVRIARALDQDPDEFLALAGRIGADIRRIIHRQPSQAARLLRAIDGLPGAEIDELVERARKKSRRNGADRNAGSRHPGDQAGSQTGSHTRRKRRAAAVSR